MHPLTCTFSKRNSICTSTYEWESFGLANASHFKSTTSTNCKSCNLQAYVCSILHVHARISKKSTTHGLSDNNKNMFYIIERWYIYRNIHIKYIINPCDSIGGWYFYTYGMTYLLINVVLFIIIQLSYSLYPYNNQSIYLR